MWTALAKDRVKWWAPMNMIMDLQVSKRQRELLHQPNAISFSSRTLVHAVKWTALL
jgi:hypothetical protein